MLSKCLKPIGVGKKNNPPGCELFFVGKWSRQERLDVGYYLRRDELPPDDTAEIVNAFVIPTELVTLVIVVTVNTSSYELLSLELFPTATNGGSIAMIS